MTSTTGKPTMRSAAIIVCVAIVAFTIGTLAGRREPVATSDSSEIELQLRAAESLSKSYEQQEQEWAAADAAFLDRNTFFRVDARKILAAINNTYATNSPHFGEHVARLSTNLGANVELGTNQDVTTSATVSFAERDREHGLAIVRIVAGHLVGVADSAKDVVEFASYRRSSVGVVLIRFPAGMVGTSTRDEGNNRRITVTFTPTRSN